MALVRDEYCRKCEQITTHTNTKCNVCAEREYRERTAEWNAKTTDEKIQDLRKRMERLEQGPPRY
jgi:ribosomal protein L37E